MSPRWCHPPAQLLVSGISSSCLHPGFGSHLRKQAASEEVGQPATLTGDSYTDPLGRSVLEGILSWNWGLSPCQRPLGLQEG